MTSLDDRLAALSPEKRLLLEILRRERGAAGTAGTSSEPKVSRPAPKPADERFGLVAPADRDLLPDDLEDAYPLTTVQLGMLYHMELTPDESTPAYHNVNSFHLRARFDTEMFDRAVQRVVARHSILRTSFDLTTYSEPLQLVHRSAAMRIDVTDLRHLETAEQQRVLELYFDAENRSLVDLTQPPLLRFHVHRRSERTFQLTLIEPHAISDGWSTTSTLAEIFTLYFALLRGGALPEEPPPATSFRAFVALERRALESAPCREFWERRLAGASSLSLPQWPGGVRSTAAPHHRKPTIVFSPETVEGLGRLARSAEVPFKSVLLASHLKALSLICGEDDVMTGTITHGRPEELDGERIRGLFVNTVPFRLKLADTTWRELVRATFDAEMELLPFRRYPLVALQRIGDLRLDTAFTFLHFHSVERLLQSGDIEFLDSGHSDRSVDHYPLSATFVYDQLTAPSLTLTLEHGAELAPEQVQLALGYYARVLRTMLTQPFALHEAVVYLSAAEIHQLTTEWGQGMKVARGPKGLHELFAAQAAATPQAIAVVHERGEITYGELDRRADLLARRLVRIGAGPEVRVALCVERGPEMIVGILGILKAGSAYVPLDPEYPAERLAFMQQDARAPILLSQRSLSGRPRMAGVPVLLLDTDPEVGLADDTAALPRGGGPESLTYVIYTSGSTGRPKGVMVAHQAIQNRLLWMLETFPLTASDRVLQKTPFSFDASIWEIFAPLLAGAQLVLARAGGHRDVAYLIQTVREQGITVLQVVPSMLQVLVGEPDFELCLSLRLLFCGGEALSEELRERLASRLPVALCNLYGPTEAAIDATFQRASDGRSGSLVPLGRPIANASTYVLRSDLGLSPLGTPGELYIGGMGLARGYLDRPDLTAQRFFPDPFGPLAGARLYRTGDRARHLPGGTLEFLGRLDAQVKIRGYRIEPGEVEVVLAQHPGIWQVAVVPRERAGGWELTAYLVANGEPTPTAELRRFVLAHLPEFMVPGTFLFLGELPRTPSGKLDRAALPATEPGAGTVEVDYAPPRTPVEELLASLWAEVLGVEKVGIHSGFFELGGHSLLVTRVTSRIREVFKIEMRMARLFEAPTVSGLAKTIEMALRASEKSHLPPLLPVGRDQPLPLSFAQQRLWFLDRLEPGDTAYNIPVFLRLSGALDRTALVRSLAEVLRRHESLRTSFGVSSGEPIQVIAAPAAVSLPRIDLRLLPAACREREVLRIATEEAGRPFDLAHGPVLRARLLELGARENVALLTMHHIVADGWSTGVLVREFGALYGAFSAGRPSPLPELSLQYADFAQWQRGWLQGQALEDQLAYWRKQLAGSPRALDLPTDRERPQGRAHRAGRSAWRLPIELVQKLEQLSSRNAATLFMTLLAAFDVLLSHYSGRDDTVVGTDIANRNHVGTEQLIGFFVNQLVLRTDLSGNPSFQELLGRVRGVALGAYAHQDLPFEKLVEELRPERDSVSAPLFHAKLVLQNAPAAELDLAGLTVRGLAVDGGAAKFEFLLNLAVTEEGLSGGVEYSADLLDATTVARILDQFELVLNRVAADSAVKLKDLRLALAMDDKERLARQQRDLKQRNLQRLGTLRRAVDAQVEGIDVGKP
jgi:amino acid adenylation domain-containing protein